MINRITLLLFIGLACWSCENSENQNDELEIDEVTLVGFWSVDSLWNSNDFWSEESNLWLEVQPELWTWYHSTIVSDSVCYMTLGGSYMYSLDTLNDTTFSVQLLPNEDDDDGRTDIYRFEGNDKFVLIQEDERRIIYGRIEPMTFEPLCDE